MFDPFAAALDAMFMAPGSAEALYVPAGGQPVTIRVIRSQPTERLALGQGEVEVDSNKIDIRRSEVARPLSGDGIQIGDENFTIQGGPRLDTEGLTWTCELQPA